MQTSNLYTTTIPPMIKALGALSKLLGVAEAAAAAKATPRRSAEYFEERLLQSHLIFDQFPLLMQIQRVSDSAKNGAARLAGIEAPAMEDTEKTFSELKARLGKTAEFLKSIKQEDIIGHEDRKITLPYWGGKHLTTLE
jgi:uncharacterized protein